MILKEIMQVIDYNEIINRCGLDINTVAVDDICFDSRKATPTSVFVCLTGALVDGHDYALGAYERGCRVFVAERYVKRLPDDAFVIIAPDTRVALAELSANSRLLRSCASPFASVIPRSSRSTTGVNSTESVSVSYSIARQLPHPLAPFPILST